MSTTNNDKGTLVKRIEVTNGQTMLTYEKYKVTVPARGKKKAHEVYVNYYCGKPHSQYWSDDDLDIRKKLEQWALSKETTRLRIEEHTKRLTEFRARTGILDPRFTIRESDGLVEVDFNIMTLTEEQAVKFAAFLKEVGK